MATVTALFGIAESRTLWAVWGTTQLHIGRYRSVRSGEWLVTFRSSSSDNPWTSLVNHPCLCLIGPISQHIMLPQSTVATAFIFNWVVCLASVRSTLYRFGVTSPTPPVAACLSQGLTMSVNSSQVSKSTVTDYMWWSYTFSTNFMCLMLVLFIRKQKQAPNLVMFRSLSVRQMFLTETSRWVEM